MKKISFLLVFAAIAAVGFSQVTVNELDYNSLSQSDQEMFAEYGNMHEYASQNAKENDSILLIYKINNVPVSRNMITDSVGVEKPEFETQYMIVYQKDGNRLAYVTTEDPQATAIASGISISAYMAGPGYKQGDDEFPEAPINKTTAPNYIISSEW